MGEPWEWERRSCWMGLRRNEEEMERMNEDEEEKGKELEYADDQSAEGHENGGEGYVHAPLGGEEDSGNYQEEHLRGHIMTPIGRPRARIMPLRLRRYRRLPRVSVLRRFGRTTASSSSSRSPFELPLPRPSFFTDAISAFGSPGGRCQWTPGPRGCLSQRTHLRALLVYRLCSEWSPMRF
jgi:hypothetical protein